MKHLYALGECVCAFAMVAAALALGYGAMSLMTKQAILASALH